MIRRMWKSESIQSCVVSDCHFREYSSFQLERKIARSSPETLDVELRGTCSLGKDAAIHRIVDAVGVRKQLEIP